jgi:hypothetical protein
MLVFLGVCKLTFGRVGENACYITPNINCVGSYGSFGPSKVACDLYAYHTVRAHTDGRNMIEACQILAVAAFGSREHAHHFRDDQAARNLDDGYCVQARKRV